MPINVGEVNATLRLNVAKEQLVEANARLAELQKEFAAAGGSATEAGRAIYAAGVQQLEVIKQLQIQVAQYQASVQTAGTTGAVGLATTGAAAATATQPVNNLAGAAAACAAALGAVRAQAAPAAAAIAAVQTQAAPAAAAVANVAAQSTAAAGGLDAAEKMASRLIQRMVLMYSLRETLRFVVELFTAAEAMEGLNRQTDISIEKIQQLHIMSGRAGIELTKMDTAMLALQKNLSQFKGGDELAELGFSFAQIFAMNPEQQFDAIMKAIGSIQSPAERTRIEIALLGTDALDPLTQKYGDLAKSAAESGRVMEDLTIHTMANTSRMYKELGGELASMGGKIVEFGQKTVETAALPLTMLSLALRGDTEGLKALAAEINHTVNSAEQIDAALKDVNATVAAAPVMGQAFIDTLRVESRVTDEQRSKLMELNEIHELTAANAMRAANVTSDQYRAFVKELEAVTAAASKAKTQADAYAKAWEEVSSAGEGFRGTLAGMSQELILSIEAGLKAGVSQHSLAVAYEATATQVKAVSMALRDKEAADKKEEAARKKWEETERKAEEDAVRLWEEYYGLVGSMSGTARDKQVADIHRWLAEKIAAAHKAGIVDADYYNALEAIAGARIDAIIQKNNELYQFSREHYEMEAQVAKDQMDEVLKHAGDYTIKQISLAIHMYTEKLKLSANWRAQADKDVDDHYNHEQQKAKETADMVMLLSGQMVKKIEADKLRLMGSSMTYDLSSAEGLKQFRQMNPAAGFKWDDQRIMDFIKKGGTLQQLVQMGVINLYAGYSPFPGLQHGARDFAGGPAIVGERGPEIINVPRGADVIPMDKVPPMGAGAGTTIVNNKFYVNGTAADVARRISDEIMRSLKLNRRFGAA